MQHQEIQDHLQTFLELVNELRNVRNDRMKTLMNCYLEQNLSIINDTLTMSIYHLKRLQKANTENDIICTQARLANEVNQKLSLSTQHFLNVSLGQIADYNEWLKSHCDLATD